MNRNSDHFFPSSQWVTVHVLHVGGCASHQRAHENPLLSELFPALPSTQRFYLGTRVNPVLCASFCRPSLCSFLGAEAPGGGGRRLWEGDGEEEGTVLAPGFRLVQTWASGTEAEETGGRKPLFIFLMMGGVALF